VGPVCLSSSAGLISHYTVFISSNKSAISSIQISAKCYIWGKQRALPLYSSFQERGKARCFCTASKYLWYNTVQFYRITLTRGCINIGWRAVVATTSKRMSGLPTCIQQCFERTKRSKIGLLYLQHLAIQFPNSHMSNLAASPDIPKYLHNSRRESRPDLNILSSKRFTRNLLSRLLGVSSSLQMQ